MPFSKILPGEMATYVMVQLAWIDNHADNLNRSGEYYSLGARLHAWASGHRTNELLTALSNLDLDVPERRAGRPHSVWTVLLQKVKSAAAVLRLSELPVGTRLRGLAPIGVIWHGTKTAHGSKPDGDCPPGEFTVTHAERGNWWMPCIP